MTTTMFQVQVKVTSFGTLFDTHTILRSLDEAVRRGQWLVFDNCHLLEDWDQKVVSHICHLMTQCRGRWSNYFGVYVCSCECSIRGAK